MSTTNSVSSPKTIKDLPIYEPWSLDKNRPSLWVIVERADNTKSALETYITDFRQSGCAFLGQFKQQKEQAIEYYNNTVGKVNTNLDYVRSETNVLPKVAFISLAGLGGWLIGFRHSTFRKVIYSSTLATGTAALCYPNEAKAISTRVVNSSKKSACKLYRQFIKQTNTSSGGEKTNVNTGVMNNNSKDQVVKLDKEALSVAASKQVKGDKGQSNDADAHMYTTRSNK